MAAQLPFIEVPLFPLSTVLYPGGQLQLRIFEPRYLDLVRECTRTGSAFGVCLILEGREVGVPALPAAVGTLAHITDFFGKKIADVKSPFAGVVLYVVATPPITKGQPVGCVGRIRR